MKQALKKYIAEGGILGSLGKRPRKRPAGEPFPCDTDDVLSRMTEALAKRISRIGTRDVVIGISGGLDSALCLLVAVRAFKRLSLPAAGIHAYTMPGFGTTKRTKSNAVKLCEGLGVKVETISIARTCRMHLKDIGHDGKTPDAAYENAQARMRTLVLMDKANMVGGIVLGTGDLSEIALGWCTYNGDHMSMFGVNSGVPKTVVRRVCRDWAQKRLASAPGDKAAVAMLDIVETPVSPELVKGQVTERSIGPYELHDFFIWNFIVNGLDRADLKRAAKKFFKGKFDDATIAKSLDIFLSRLISQAFKRNCAPDGIKIFPFDFSRDGWWIPSDLPRNIL